MTANPLLVHCLFAAVTLAAPRVAEASPSGKLAGRFQRGVCYAHAWHGGGNDGYGSATSARTLGRLKALGVDAISLTPFGFMESPESTEVRLITAFHGAGESDERLATEISRAHKLGLRVTLKPHIWIRRGEWQGDLRWGSDEAFKRFMASYKTFVLHYAELAERHHVDLLVIGTELKSATLRDGDAFRALAAEVRRVYHGPITYAANWDEAEHITFWDVLDFVGVDAYAPLVKHPGATPDELAAAWQNVARQLKALGRRAGRRVILTEIGYRATADAAMAPATWPESDPRPRFDPAHQAACYRAALGALWGRPWLAGLYFWKWFTDDKDEQGPTDFSPSGKPAERVLAEFYRRR